MSEQQLSLLYPPTIPVNFQNHKTTHNKRKRQLKYYSLTHKNTILPIEKEYMQWERALCVGLSINREQITIAHNGLLYCFNQSMQTLEIFITLYPKLFKRKQCTVILCESVLETLQKLFSVEYPSILDRTHPNLKVLNTIKAPYCIFRYKERNIYFIERSTFFNGNIEQYREYYASEYDNSQKANILEKLCLELRERQGKYNISIACTRGKLAERIFRKQYLKKPIPKISTEYREFIEKCRHGPIQICYNRGYDTSRKWYMYDRNGLYAEAIRDVVLPMSGKVIKASSKKGHLYNEEYMGWAKVYFEFPHTVKRPNLPVYREGLKFPRTGISYCTFYEIRLAKRLGAKIQFIEGICWKITQEDIEHPLRDYVIDLLDLKDSSTRLLESTTAQRGKHILNIQSAKQQYTALFGLTAQVKESVKGCYVGNMHSEAFNSLITAKARTTMFEYANMFNTAYIHTDSLLIDEKLPEDYVGITSDKFKCESPIGCFPMLIKVGRYALFDPITNNILKCGHHSIYFTEGYNVRGYIKSLLESIGSMVYYGESQFKFSIEPDSNRVYNENLIRLEDLRANFTSSEPLEH